MKAPEQGAQFAGLMNLAVFGRSVTLLLQNMRTLDAEGFNAWYAPFETEMRGDELMQYFSKLRNEVLKEGPPRAQVGFLLKGPFVLSPSNGPPGTKSVGLTMTGLVYNVALPDGTTQAYRAPFPPEARWTPTWHMPNPPKSHLGIPLLDPVDTDIVALATKYMLYLKNLTDQAAAHFLQ